MLLSSKIPVGFHCEIFRRSRPRRVMSIGVDRELSSVWEDEFTSLQDRRDLEPLPLPSVTSRKRVVLVRHGQSTWNAEGRIQGSSNHAILTSLGEAQAETTRQMLMGENFGFMLHSPLERSKKTAEIIMDYHNCLFMELPQLREIDLYSMQGLLKHEGKERFGPVYTDWQRRPHELMIDNHAPVRELWYRASLAWQTILSDEHHDASCILVVAHNAVNQALICSAARFAPIYFRRLLQSNAAVTVIDIEPSLFDVPRVTIDRLNQSPSPPLNPDGAGREAQSRIVFVRHGDSEQCRSDLILGQRDEPCSSLGNMQAMQTAELLSELECDIVITSPLMRSKSTAERICQAMENHPELHEWDELIDWDAGEWEMRLIREVRSEQIPSSAEARDVFWNRCGIAWKKLIELTENRTVIVTTHSAVIAAMLGHCLDIGMRSLSLFRHDGGGVTIIDFADEPTSTNGVIRCSNYSAHLGRWAIPVTRDDLDQDFEMHCFLVRTCSLLRLLPLKKGANFAYSRTRFSTRSPRRVSGLEEACLKRNQVAASTDGELKATAPDRPEKTILTLPTVLTLARVVAIPLLGAGFYIEQDWSPLVCSVLFIVASLTDWLDGFLARKMGSFSSFGAFLDPVADKLMVATALILLSSSPIASGYFQENKWILPMLSLIIIGREITMSSLREWAATVSKEAYKAVAVSLWGKWKTASQVCEFEFVLLLLFLFFLIKMSSIVLLLLASDGKVTHAGYMTDAGIFLLSIAACLSLWSLMLYFRNVWKYL
eukprot:g276.t1